MALRVGFRSIGKGTTRGKGVRTQIVGTKFGPLGGGSGTGVQGDASHLGATSRLRIDMPAYDIVLGALTYWNGRISFNSAGEIAGPNSINNKAALEQEAGAIVPLYDPSAARTGAIAGGATQWMRPQGRIIVPQGSKPFARQFVSVASGGTWPVSRIAHITGLGESENTFATTGAGTDQVDATGTFGNATGNVYAWGPSAIYGIPADGLRRPTVGIMGDSLNTVSGGDGSPNYGDANGYAGWLERKIGGQIATINASRASSRLMWVAAGMANQVTLMAPYIKSVIIALGRNDISNAQNATQIQTNFAAAASYFQANGVDVFFCTLTPKPATTSNGWADGGATLNSSEEAVRSVVNPWVRSMPLGIRGFLDPCAYVEDPARPGFWLPGYTTDGTHMTVAAMSAAGDAVDLNAFA